MDKIKIPLTRIGTEIPLRPVRLIEVPLTPVRLIEVPLTPIESEKMTWQEALKLSIKYSLVATKAINDSHNNSKNTN